MVYGCIRQETWGVNLYVSNSHTKLLIFEPRLKRNNFFWNWNKRLELFWKIRRVSLQGDLCKFL